MCADTLLLSANKKGTYAGALFCTRGERGIRLGIILVSSNQNFHSPNSLPDLLIWVPLRFSNPHESATQHFLSHLHSLRSLRREGDSNPRYSFEYATFPRWYIRPLCHLSNFALVHKYFSAKVFFY